ncbi:hypothetical protein ACN47E_008560 [Coniothyrium glycines]
MAAPFQFGTSSTPQFTGVRNVPQLRIGDSEEVASLQRDIVAACSALAEARAANAQLGAQVTCAFMERDKAKECERIARSLFLTCKGMEGNDSQWDEAVGLQRENDKLKQQLQDQRAQLSVTQTEVVGRREELEKANKELEAAKAKIEDLYSVTEQLKGDLSHEKEATAHHESALTTTYAELDHERAARKAANKARDDALVEQKDIELQFEDLRAQWEEDQERIADLQEQLDDFDKVDAAHKSLLDDLETLRGHLADTERTLFVKDERILHLETQYQKELLRNKSAADADDLAAGTMSPVEEPPTALNTVADSLEQELAEAFGGGDHDYEESFRELIELSDTIEIINLAPVPPKPSLVTHSNVHEAANVIPVLPAPTRLILGSAQETANLAPTLPAPVLNSMSKTHDIVNSAPSQPTHAPCTLSDTHEAANFVPSQPLPAHISMSNTLEAVNFAPRQPAPTLNSISDMHYVANFPPDHPSQARISFSDTFTAVESTPIQPVHVPSSLSIVHEAANVASVSAHSPIHVIEHGETIEVTPEQAVEPRLAIDLGTASNTSPIEPASQSLSFAEAEMIASITPVEVHVPTHIQSPITHASVTPVAPAISTTVSGTQTDRQSLRSEIAHHAVLSTAPIVPTTPDLTQHVVDSASITVESIEASQAGVGLTSNIPDHARITVEPVDSIDSEEDLTYSMLSHATQQTTPLELPEPDWGLGTIMVDDATIDIAPIDPPESNSNLSTSMIDGATIETTPLEALEIDLNLSKSIIDSATIAIDPVDVEPKSVPAPELTISIPKSASTQTSPSERSIPDSQPAANGKHSPTPRHKQVLVEKMGYPYMTMFFLLGLLLAGGLHYVKMWQELDTWENANGTGIWPRNGAMYDRILFSTFPVSTESGLLGPAIRTFEHLFGISHPPPAC